MGLVAQAGKASLWEGTFIVRDRDGNPRFDDPNNVPQKILDVLTESDKEYLLTLQTKVE